MFNELLLGEGAILGAELAIPLKFGVSLDPTYYGILFIKALNASMPIMANSAWNASDDFNKIILGLVIIGIFGGIFTFLDAYRKLQDDLMGNGVPYGCGILVGFGLIVMV